MNGLPPTPVTATLRVGGAVAVIPVVLGVAFLGRYGWDRDELYFLAAARHPSLGYVDFPPLVAWIGWVVEALVGPSLEALRVASAVIAWSSVVVVALIARELGGSLRAQAIAAVGWGCAPLILGAGSIFHPTMLDVGIQAVLVWLVVRIVVRDEPRLWPVVGLVAGVGIEAKYTILVTLAALLAALALTADGRRVLAGRGIWIASAVALVLWVPNLAWQAHEGWPSLAFASSQQAKTAADTPVPAYLAEGLLFAGAGVVLAIAGVRYLWRQGLRSLALWPVLVWVIWLLERGRAYYPLPVLVVAVAAGAVSVERHRRWLVLAGLLGAGAVLVAGPVVVPLLPTRFAVDHGYVQAGFFKDEFGWPDMVDQVAAAWRSERLDSRHAVVLAGNYGEAGALALLGTARGLPTPLSGHLSWQYWRPRSLPQRTALTVGIYPGDLATLCRSWRPVAQITNAAGVANEERGRLIAICHLRAPIGTLWSSIARNAL